MRRRGAAANAEMPADRLDAFGACNLDFGEMTAVRVAGPGPDLGDLARQRIGHLHGASGGGRSTPAPRLQCGVARPLPHGVRYPGRAHSSPNPPPLLTAVN